MLCAFRGSAMRSVIAVLGIWAAAVAWAAPPESGLPLADPVQVGMSAERLARIQTAMQRHIDAELVAGTVTLVARRGQVVHFDAQGWLDAEAQTPMHRDAIFRIASMTKPITSVALMTLWEEGLVQLNDPVAKFLPEFADQKVSTTADASGETGELVAPRRPATVRDMLLHTAGLANGYIGNAEAYGAATRFRDGDTLATLIERLAALPLNYHPGDAWQYSAATDVIGRLVEVISGMPLDRFFDVRIFQPLGMTDTHFFLDDTKGGRFATQYAPDDNGRIRVDDPGSEASRWIAGPKTVFRGAGGLVSTARDYLRFQQMVLNGGELGGVRLLAPATVSLILENHTGELPLWLAGPGMGFGLGYAVVVDRGRAATPMSRGSAYWGGAFNTFSWFDPEQELVAVLMSQVRPYTHLTVRQEFQNLVYQAIVE
jgi:CubicO group peptidase (beta-lactamase class C family)